MLHEWLSRREIAEKFSLLLCSGRCGEAGCTLAPGKCLQAKLFDLSSCWRKEAFQKDANDPDSHLIIFRLILQLHLIVRVLPFGEVFSSSCCLPSVVFFPCISYFLCDCFWLDDERKATDAKRSQVQGMRHHFTVLDLAGHQGLSRSHWCDLGSRNVSKETSGATSGACLG